MPLTSMSNMPALHIRPLGRRLYGPFFPKQFKKTLFGEFWSSLHLALTTRTLLCQRVSPSRKSVSHRK
jgi:hypothetical protein